MFHLDHFYDVSLSAHDLWIWLYRVPDQHCTRYSAQPLIKSFLLKLNRTKNKVLLIQISCLNPHVLYPFYVSNRINGSSWSNAANYFHHLIRGRRGRLSFLLELTNCYDTGGKNICTKNIWFLRFKCMKKRCENCVLRLTNLNRIKIFKLYHCTYIKKF